MLLSFPTRAVSQLGPGQPHLSVQSGEAHFFPAAGSKLLKAVSSSHMGIAAQHLLVSVTAERKSESVENAEAALHNN